MPKLTELLEISVKKNASDLHISPHSPPTLRINGDLTPLKELGLLSKEMTSQLLKSVMTEVQFQEFNRHLDIDFTIMIPDLGSFRVNAFHQAEGMAAVFRVTPSTTPTLESLDTPPIFKQILELSSGLIIIAGPTGCGKSTTLAAMIQYINAHQSNHIITIEDPIEYIHPSLKSIVNQRQVHRDAVSFNQALRAALREDPDIILIGELRDLECIRLALTAAETGHLVMTTLHTSSAPHAIRRIIDVFPGGEKNIIRNQISESLQAVICQTLVQKIAGGRIAAFEIMLGTPAIRNLIREDKLAQMYSVIQTSGNLGMCTMKQYLSDLIEKGIVAEEAARESGFQRELFEKF